jgi:hypothetical protein
MEDLLILLGTMQHVPLICTFTYVRLNFVLIWSNILNHWKHFKNDLNCCYCVILLLSVQTFCKLPDHACIWEILYIIQWSFLLERNCRWSGSRLSEEPASPGAQVTTLLLGTCKMVLWKWKMTMIVDILYELSILCITSDGAIRVLGHEWSRACSKSS